MEGYRIFQCLRKIVKDARLGDILWRGTYFEVAEHPPLVDLVDVSDNAEDDVRKTFSLEHLFYHFRFLNRILPSSLLVSSMTLVVGL